MNILNKITLNCYIKFQICSFNFFASCYFHMDLWISRMDTWPLHMIYIYIYIYICYFQIFEVHDPLNTKKFPTKYEVVKKTTCEKHLKPRWYDDGYLRCMDLTLELGVWSSHQEVWVFGCRIYLPTPCQHMCRWSKVTHIYMYQ